MTDLNKLIAAGSPWFLLEPLGINDRGQIAGYAFNTSTGEVHGYVATPCEGDQADADGCEDRAEAATAAPGQTRQRPPKIVLSEKVRKLEAESKFSIMSVSKP